MGRRSRSNSARWGQPYSPSHTPRPYARVFQLSPESYECRPFNGHYKSVMGAHSLLVSDGIRHRRMRRILMPPLHRRLVETHGEATRRSVRRALNQWAIGQAFSPRPAMHMVALEIILGIIFGSGDDELGREILRTFSEEIYQDLGSWSAWTRFVHHQPRFRGLISEKVDRRRTGVEPCGGTLFDALLQGRDEAGDLLDDDEVQDHIFTMLVAGVDPTALALSWALYWIHEDSEVLSRLRREIDSLGPEAAPRSDRRTAHTSPRSARRRSACTRS